MTTLDLPRELQLLLLTAGGVDQDPMIRRLLEREIDWPCLCRLADRELASSVLWARLSALGCRTSPATAPLQNLARVSEFTLLLLRRRLYETLDALASGGIDVLLLKGAAIAHTAYPAFTQRPMGDIDLLVGRDHAAPAHRIARAGGWAERTGGHSVEVYDGHQHLPPLYDARGVGISLDLHTELFCEGQPFRFTAESMWASAQRVWLDGHPAYLPGPGHQLLHTCLHFAWSHIMASGAWRTFRDVGAIARTDLVNWDEFVRLAKESGGATCCYWTFRLARTVSGAELPAEVLRALRPPHPESMLRRIERHFILGLLPTSSTCPSVRLCHLVWQLGVLPGRSGHGTARPWDRTHRFVRSAPGAGAPSTLRKFSRHLSGAGTWARYARAVLSGPFAS